MPLRLPLAVPCPLCKAAAHQPCVIDNPYLRRRYHLRRIDAARQRPRLYAVTDTSE